MRLYLTFGTTHGALQAERILKASGIEALIVPKPAAIHGPCGLAVRLREADGAPALAALAVAGHEPRQQVRLP